MKLGSLFSGGGLGDFGFMAAGMEISWQCEIDEYCQKILALRYPESKKYCDIKTLKGGELEPVDILTGGFPCQPFSVAGKRKGKDDNRYLWPEMLRVIKECRPRWIVGENVVGITNLALGNICSDLEAEGYEVWPIVFPSHALGAWHKRDRIWIICNSQHTRFSPEEIIGGVAQRSHNSQTKEKQAIQSSGSGEQHAPMANSKCFGQSGQGKHGQSLYQKKNRNRETGWIINGSEIWKRYWEFEPEVGRVANGITDRVHRLKMLGNGQVPACTYVIGKMIMKIELLTK